MQLPNGDPTPIPAPDWTDAVIVPLDHGGLAVQDSGASLAFMIFYGFLVIGLAVAFILRASVPKNRFRNAKTRLAALAAAGLLAVAGILGVTTAGITQANAGSAHNKSAATWVQHRYEVKLTPAQADRLLNFKPLAVETLGIRTEVHLSQATDGKYYLFDATGRELPTTVDTGTGGPGTGDEPPSTFCPNTGDVQPPDASTGTGGE